MKQKSVYSLLMIVLLGSCSQQRDSRESVANKPEEKEEIIQNRYLLLDSRIIEYTENAKLVVGTVEKYQNNPLFSEDKPWEKRFDNLYGNVIYDQEEAIYKCWYSPFIVDESAKGMTLDERKAKSYNVPDNREMAICYATSMDGINWVKPELNLIEFEGNSTNNILWRGGEERDGLWEGPHGTGVFKDLLDPNPNRRYKAILKGEILSVSFSSDGIRWDPPATCPEADVPGDTHNNAFWAPTLDKYVGITREWGKYTGIDGVENKKITEVLNPTLRRDTYNTLTISDEITQMFFDGNEDDEKKGRQVARIESKDFVNWTKAEVVLEGMDLNHQTYAMPVFFYGGVYLGLLAIHQQSSDRVWTELTWSPDTKNWNRISPGTPLIPNSNEELDYDWGCVYACATPLFMENEIRLYYGGSDWLHTSWRNAYLCMATLRPDGFAGYEQESDSDLAVITTTPIPYSGKDIFINGDVAEGGSIQVAILDKNSNEITQALPISATVTNGQLRLNDIVVTDQIRFRFELNRAKLYSFSFED